MGNLSLQGHGNSGQSTDKGDTPHLDDIPDMEEHDLEEEDNATAAPVMVSA
jgi:hypothetical protein